MGIFDKFKGKAEDLKDKAGDLVDQHGDKVGEGLDKAGDFVDEKTGGKYGDKIDQGVDKAKEGLDNGSLETGALRDETRLIHHLEGARIDASRPSRHVPGVEGAGPSVRLLFPPPPGGAGW